MGVKTDDEEMNPSSVVPDELQYTEKACECEHQAEKEQNIPQDAESEAKIKYLEPTSQTAIPPKFPLQNIPQDDVTDGLNTDNHGELIEHTAGENDISSTLPQRPNCYKDTTEYTKPELTQGSDVALDTDPSADNCSDLEEYTSPLHQTEIMGPIDAETNGDRNAMYNVPQEELSLGNAITPNLEVDQKGDYGYSPLYKEALKELRTDDDLIAGGVDQNKQDKTGFSPLDSDTKEEHIDIGSGITLYEAYANVCDWHAQSRTQLHTTTVKENTDCVDSFLAEGNDINKEDNSGWTRFNAATQYDDLEIIDMSKKEASCWGQIQVAIETGNLAVLKNLLTNGRSSIRLQNTSLLYIAAQYGHTAIAEFLISEGADVNEEISNGRIPLHAAASNGHVEVLKCLIDQGSDVNKTDDRGWAPLHLAIKSGRVKIIQYLKKTGAEDFKFDGMTVLFLATLTGHLEVIKLFISDENINEEESDGQTALHIAATRGDLSISEYLIEHGSDVDKKDNKGYTPFHTAIENGHLDVVKYLLQKRCSYSPPPYMSTLFLAAQSGHTDIVEFLISEGADVNEEISNGRIPLHAAASNGHVEVVKCLIDQGSDVNKTDERGWAPLHLAIKSGHVKVIQYLRKTGAEDSKFDGMTVLFLATLSGHLEVIKLFISEEEYIDEECDGQTALHIAAARGDLSISKYLIEHGSDVDKKDYKGYTPFHTAIENGHLDVAKYLLQKRCSYSSPADLSALFIAAQSGHTAIVAFLISEGADVNEEISGGRIPLHGASSNGHVEVVKYLIDQGSDVNKEDDSGWAPLHFAIGNGNVEVVKYLMTRGANASRLRGMPALSLAALHAHLEVMRFFISVGADVNEEIDGKIALHFAAAVGDLPITQYLIQEGSDVDKKDDKGHTPLHTAVKNGHLDVMKCFLEKRCRFSKQQDMSPLFIAAESGHADIVEFLISEGADVNEEISNGRIPLHAAASNGHVEVVKCLIDQGSDLNKTDDRGWAPLHLAIKSGQVEVIQSLKSGKALYSKFDGMTVLFLATLSGHLEVIKLFISEEEYIDEECDGQTALHIAAARGDLSISKYLIEHGSDVDKKDYRGYTPFHTAIENGHLDVAKYLLQKKCSYSSPADLSALFIAARSGHTAIVAFLIAEGADVNEEISGGRIPLHGASSNGHVGVVKYLIDQGSDVNKEDDSGWAPLHLAIRNGNVEVVKCLMTGGANASRLRGTPALSLAALFAHLEVMRFFISVGADVNEEIDGKIALHFAAAVGDLTITQYLIQEGSNVDKKDDKGHTPLHNAIENGHLYVMKCFLEKGCRFSKRQDMSPLFIAAESGHTDIVEFLISEGADVNEEISNGRIPLHAAASNGYVEVVKYLVDQGSDVNKKDDSGWAPLHLAVKNGYVEVVKCLMTEGANESRLMGMTLLSLASFFEHLKVMKFLISVGADVNEECNGKTALHIAATRGDLTITQYLIQQGANADKKDGNGYTPFHAAIENGHLNVVKYLHEEGCSCNRPQEMSPLCIAAQSGNTDIVQFLISEGAHVNEESSSGRIPLHVAAANGHVEVVKYLVDQRSDVNKKDNTGWTPLHSAIENGHVEVIGWLKKMGAEDSKFGDMTPMFLATRSGCLGVVKYFISLGADVNEEIGGQTALHVAATNGHLEIVKYLIDQGSDVNKQDDTRCTPLYLAVENGHVEVIRLLREVGAGDSSTKFNGMTPMFLATRSGYLEVVKYFISTGADVNEECNGKTSLHIAATRGDLTITQYLIQQGANVDKTDENGYTPFHAAIESGHLNVVKYLHEKGCSFSRPQEMSPLCIAAQSGHTDIVQFFAPEGAQVNKCVFERGFDENKEHDTELFNLAICKSLQNSSEIHEKSAISTIKGCRKVLETPSHNGFGEKCRVEEQFFSEVPKLLDGSDDFSGASPWMIPDSPPAQAKEDKPVKCKRALQTHVAQGGNPTSTQFQPDNSRTGASVKSGKRMLNSQRRRTKLACSSLLTELNFLLIMTVFVFKLLPSAIIVSAVVETGGVEGISERAESLMLKAGSSGTIPFRMLYPNDTSPVIPFYTLGFKSKIRPFYVNGEIDPHGFQNPAQASRFTFLRSEAKGTISVDINVDSVDIGDMGVYVFTVILFGRSQSWRSTVRKKVEVRTPPGPAHCVILNSQYSAGLHEVHCQAATGDASTTLSCYQKNYMLPHKDTITSHGSVTRGVFWLFTLNTFSCCSHYMDHNVAESMCNDYVWSQTHEHILTTDQTHDHILTTAVSTAPLENLPPSISFTESGSCIRKSNLFYLLISLITLFFIL